MLYTKSVASGRFWGLVSLDRCVVHRRRLLFEAAFADLQISNEIEVILSASASIAITSISIRLD
jgi:hypothetical protein